MYRTVLTAKMKLKHTGQFVDFDLYNIHRRAFLYSVYSEPISNTTISLQLFLTKKDDKPHNIKLAKAIANMFRTRGKIY